MSDHAHRWRVKRRVYNPPRTDMVKFWQGSMSEAGVMSVLYGITSLEQKCEICGKTEISWAPGDLR